MANFPCAFVVKASVSDVRTIELSLTAVLVRPLALTKRALVASTTAWFAVVPAVSVAASPLTNTCEPVPPAVPRKFAPPLPVRRPLEVVAPVICVPPAEVTARVFPPLVIEESAPLIVAPPLKVDMPVAPKRLRPVTL